MCKAAKFPIHLSHQGKIFFAYDRAITRTLRVAKPALNVQRKIRTRRIASTCSVTTPQSKIHNVESIVIIFFIVKYLPVIFFNMLLSSIEEKGNFRKQEK